MQGCQVLSVRGLLGAAERAQAIPNFPDYLELVLDQHVVQMVSCNFMFGGCNMMGFYSEDPPHRDKRDLWLAVTRAKMAGARGGVGGVRTGSTQSESVQCVCVCVCARRRTLIWEYSKATEPVKLNKQIYIVGNMN